MLTAKLLDATDAEILDPPGTFSWWSTDWGWDPGSYTIATVEFLPDRRQLRLTGLTQGTATYFAYVDGPIGPSPVVEVTSVVTVY